MPKRNIAARAGRWSALHRKTAIGGWLAFVVIAFVLGGAIGTKELADEDTGNGSSRTADAAINRADFPEKADEQVLVQARGGKLTVDDAAFKAGVDEVVTQLEGAPNTADVASPFAQGNEGQISEDRRSALVTFSIPGDENARREGRSDARRHGGRAEGAPRPADRAVRRRQRRQGARRLRSTTTSSGPSSSRSRSR